MLQTPTQSETETLLLNLPKTLKLYVTPPGIGKPRSKGSCREVRQRQYL
jgi:hypothetical protein